MTTLTITLPKPYPLLNQMLKAHYATKAKKKRAWRWHIVASLGGAHALPKEPFKKAHIRIERHSVGTPDHDNVVGGAKPLLDCLTTPRLNAHGHIANKHGLGIIEDDSPAHITTDYHAVKCRLCEQKTVITITDLTGEDV